MDRLELIDKYLLDELSPTLQAEFDKLYAKDASFKQEVLEKEAVVKLLKQSRVSELQDQIAGVKSNFDKERKSRKYIRAIGAIAILLASLFFAYKYILSPNSVKVERQWVAEDFEAYPMSLSVRGEDSPPNLIELERLYQSEDYNASISLLEKIIASSDYDGKWHLYLACAQAKTDDLPNAITNLQIILDKDDKLYEDQAKKYLTVFQQ